MDEWEGEVEESAEDAEAVMREELGAYYFVGKVLPYALYLCFSSIPCILSHFLPSLL